MLPTTPVEPPPPTLERIASRCVQTRISSPTDAASAFMSSGSRDINLVAVPTGAMLCCQFVSIPSGFFVLGQRWHKNIGAVDPGFKMCWPFYYRVSHVVTRATITYSAPSRQVPCADNVMVDINLSLTFSIGPSFEDAEAFIYTLGCTRFDEFLAAEVEEGVRGLVYSVTHDRVNDLREEFAQSMLASLSSKFRPFGVQALARGSLLTSFPHAFIPCPTPTPSPLSPCPHPSPDPHPNPLPPPPYLPRGRSRTSR